MSNSSGGKQPESVPSSSSSSSSSSATCEGQQDGSGREQTEQTQYMAAKSTPGSPAQIASGSLFSVLSAYSADEEKQAISLELSIDNTLPQQQQRLGHGGANVADGSVDVEKTPNRPHAGSSAAGSAAAASAAAAQEEAGGEQEKQEEGKIGQLKRLLRRHTTVSRHQSHPHWLEDAASQQSDEVGLLERFINLTGGGLVPAIVDTSQKTTDLENGEAAVSSAIADMEVAAQQIVQAHHQSEEGAAGDSSTNGSSTGTGSEATCVPPLMERYDDEFNERSDDNIRRSSDFMYVAPPQHVRSGVLGSLLRLYRSSGDTAATVSPRGGVAEGRNPDREAAGTPGIRADGPKQKRPKAMRLASAAKLKRKWAAGASEARITVHIADLLQRHRFIVRLCQALMQFGAPTHRLEEYMVMTSRVLEIDGQFLYLPGCMLVSFGDCTTRTSDVQLVRCTQGLDLWRLHQVHSIYKQVVHDVISVEDASRTIDGILVAKKLYPEWACVFLYGFCSSLVTPFAFGGDWVNMLVSLGIGCCVGLLKYIVAQRSNVYSNVFEITASIVVSFCARALASIPNSNICFGATVQGSLALIFPGYMILCGSLELQSRNLVAGSVRMFYAVIYSLFIGYGITLGAALFGWLYEGATNETTCERNVSPWFRFIFVPLFSMGLSLINQARWTQLPVMVFISYVGYMVTYWSGKHFSGSTEFTASLGAFVIGIMGNLYSRIWKGLAMTAMLPGILVLVPSGIASKSTLLSSVENANNIVSNKTYNGIDNVNSGTSISFGIAMIQVCIGISVGLFASTLFVYPFGKKRTGLFTL
ncbi:pheromone-regulated protein PRM10 Ecym_6360 [Eremothecium cymbalariae DBVPG|uniref:Pheromone-regulated membrane protein 10 n=1 Tax=Eremothecium cymbalariae (strain CBS 270.75 / DBVPG 7215 / KCTC 17166 / NRRL Y-17582) TaxID=931890 RepID=G8JUF6_ERECY|nr:hypothetical protein Ecym_6360 [Eremothecium cymbalariae DBVPG\